MSREAFENYMALYWKLNGRWPDSETVWNAAISEHENQIETLRGVVVGYKQRIAELEQCIDRQAKAALSGMDSAKAHGVEALRVAQQKEAALKPELIESEREINAFLTEENEAQAEQLFHAKRRIAELEKDADILQTNLDDALRYKRADEKLVDIINGLGEQQQKPKHGRQA